VNVGQAECDAVAATEVFLKTRQTMFTIVTLRCVHATFFAVKDIQY